MDTDAAIDTRSIAPTVCRLLGVDLPDECEVEPIPEIVRALAAHPRLALIVIDALGVASFMQHGRQAPFLSGLIETHYLPMQAMYPTIAPVNFASMATGVSPVRHSIRDRQESIINDTVFDALRRGSRQSAIGARALSTLNLLLAGRADAAAVADDNTDSGIMARVESLLEDSIPDFFWIQLLDMDDAQHRFGVANPSAGKVLARLDRNLTHLCDLFTELDFGVIICADHGQHDNDDNTGGTHDGTSPDDSVVPVTWTGE